MKKNNFDSTALFYDSLAWLIFKNSIFQSQLVYINQIPLQATILVIGGGTGKVLPEIIKVRPDVQIVYIELSKKMLDKSKKRLIGYDHDKIQFIHGDETIIKDLNIKSFDVVITSFFLDVFSSERLLHIMQTINVALKGNGFWINTDFYVGNETSFQTWKRWFIKIMYLFFKFFCNLEGNRLLDFKTYFNRIDLSLLENQRFYHNMIHADLYIKKNI